MTKAPGAYRYSQRYPTPDGKERIDMRANTTNTNGPTITELAATGDVITAAEVNEWLEPLRTGRNKLEPTDEEIQNIVFWFNIIRISRYREELEPDTRQTERVTKAIDAILTDAPGLIEFSRKSMENAGSHASQASVERTVAFVNDMIGLMATAYNVRKYPFMRVGARKDRRDSFWHRDLEYIAHLLDSIERYAIAPSATNEGGPAVPFLVKALQRTGTLPDANAATIGKTLRRLRDRAAPIYDFRKGEHG
jgi:hypothetical protein